MHQDVQLPTGVLGLDIDWHHPSWPLARLSDFGARANPKRGFLIVSKILGRHIPATPADLREALDALAGGIAPDLPGPVLIIGMAETATAMGQGIHAAYVRDTGRTDVLYAQTTRQTDGREALLTFEESHSHASSHLVLTPRSSDIADIYATARTLIIVDDECSTGKTFAALSASVLPHLPSIERIETVVLTDWSGGAYIETMPLPTVRHALLKGLLTWTAVPHSPLIAPLAAAANTHGRVPVNGTPARYGILVPAEGVADQSGLPLVRGERILVLGEGEFTYQALVAGETLTAMGNDVRVQGITRSPVLEGGAIGDTCRFPDPYRSGADCFLYNALGAAYDRIVIIGEVPAGEAPDMAGIMAGQLPGNHGTKVERVVFSWNDTSEGNGKEL